MKIVITGGAGYIGSKLAQRLLDQGHEIFVFTRRKPKKTIGGVEYFETDILNNLPEDILQDADAVIHLAGASIFARWTKKYKKLIHDSRVKTTQKLVKVIKLSKTKPKVFITSSAIGFYGDAGETILDESSKNGKDFLAHVCRDWEFEAKKVESSKVRYVTVRTGIVLGGDGGMIAQILPLFKLGLGGKLGNGKQWFSWIHIDDLLDVYLETLKNSKYSGPVNAVSPNSVSNAEFTKTLGKILKRPTFFRVPVFLLKIVLGELGGLVTGSQRVKPVKLIENGFDYKYESLEKALKNILKK